MTPNDAPFLRVENITKTDANGSVLNPISFEQQQFKKIAIAGETGSGKSTLLKIIGGLIQPDSGKVFFEGSRVLGPMEQLIPGHKGIVYLSQHFELPKNLTVEQILIYANPLWDDEAAKDPFAHELYETCKITHLLARRTKELSGGEKQRVALTKLLITKPKILLLDEPFSNLDFIHKNILKAVIKAISEKLAISCVLISHDPIDTLSWADEIYVLKNGNIIQHGNPLTIYHHPINSYVAGLFGKFYEISHDLALQLGVHVSKNKPQPIFIRPEYFKLYQHLQHEPAKPVVKARVLQHVFCGSYFETEILIGQQSFIAKTDSSLKLNIGDEIFVLLVIS